MFSRAAIALALAMLLLGHVGAANAQQNEWCGPTCTQKCGGDAKCIKEWAGRNKAKYGKYVSVCLKSVCKQKCDATHLQSGQTRTECYGAWGRRNAGISD
jgi:hypothetical protein